MLLNILSVVQLHCIREHLELRQTDLKLDVAKDSISLVMRMVSRDQFLTESLFQWYLGTWGTQTLDLSLHVFTQRYARLFKTTKTQDICQWTKDRFYNCNFPMLFSVSYVYITYYNSGLKIFL